MARMRYGENPYLEAEANEILRQSLAGVTSHEAKRDILTPWKAKDRLSREVYTSSGTPDASLRRGQFGRAANKTRPHLNSREGKAGAPAKSEGSRDRSFSIQAFIDRESTSD